MRLDGGGWGMCVRQYVSDQTEQYGARSRVQSGGDIVWGQSEGSCGGGVLKPQNVRRSYLEG